MSELATHLIAYVDSHNAQEGTDTHFSYTIQLPSMARFDSVCVLQASIPKSFYLIATGFNTFTLIENGVTSTVTIPVGNYTRRALQLTLQTVLNDASPGHLAYTVTVPNAASEVDTGKFGYTVVPDTSQVSFVFGQTYQPCEALGFDIGSTNQFFFGSLRSSNVCRLQAKSTIYIKSNCVDNGGTGILQAVFGADPDFSVINFQIGNAGGISANRKELIISRNNRFVFIITDEDGVQLDTNGLSVAFSLLIWDSKRYSFTAGSHLSDK